MKVFNLTDVAPPWDKTRVPRDLKFQGSTIPAGGWVEFKQLELNIISGWVRQNLVGIDDIPRWYARYKEIVAKTLEVKEPPPRRRSGKKKD